MHNFSHRIAVLTMSFIMFYFPQPILRLYTLACPFHIHPFIQFPPIITNTPHTTYITSKFLICLTPRISLIRLFERLPFQFFPGSQLPCLAISISSAASLCYFQSFTTSFNFLSAYSLVLTFCKILVFLRFHTQLSVLLPPKSGQSCNHIEQSSRDPGILQIFLSGKNPGIFIFFPGNPGLFKIL